MTNISGTQQQIDQLNSGAGSSDKQLSPFISSLKESSLPGRADGFSSKAKMKGQRDNGNANSGVSTNDSKTTQSTNDTDAISPFIQNTIIADVLTACIKGLIEILHASQNMISVASVFAKDVLTNQVQAKAALQQKYLSELSSAVSHLNPSKSDPKAQGHVQTLQEEISQAKSAGDNYRSASETFTTAGQNISQAQSSLTSSCSGWLETIIKAVGS